VTSGVLVSLPPGGLPIDDAGIRRLLRSLDHPNATAWAYRALAAGGAVTRAPARLADLLLRIAALPTAEMPHWKSSRCDCTLAKMKRYRRSSRRRTRTSAHGPVQRPQRAKTISPRHHLHVLSHGPRRGGRHAGALSSVQAAIRTHQTYPGHHDDFVCSLMALAAARRLDGLCGGSPEELVAGVRILESIREFRQNPRTGYQRKSCSRGVTRNPQRGIPPLHA